MFVIFIYASINTHRLIVYTVRLLIVSSNDTVKQSVHNLLGTPRRRLERGRGHGVLHIGQFLDVLNGMRVSYTVFASLLHIN